MLKNTALSIVNQIITIICGFILPKFFLVYYGSEINGLVSSITQFLSFVTFLEMGIGAVVQSNLYKPLAENDIDLLSRIMKSARRFYRIIAGVFMVYIVLLCVFYPLTVKTSFDLFFTIALIIIISISSLMQYYFGIVNQILLNADQKAYIPLFLQSVTLFANTLVCYILMRIGLGIHIVKLGTAFIYLLRPLGQYYYVKKNYMIDYSIEVKEEPIKQKWNGFAQHIAAMVLEHTDVAVLTIFSTLINVSIYTVYYNVVCGVRRLFSTVIDSLRATFGNLLAKDDKDSLNVYFGTMESVVHFFISLIFACTFVLIIPFVKVYTKGINDANYIVPAFAVIITTAYLFYCLRVFYNMMVLAAGHYKETQNASFIEALINLTISIICVSQFGLIGVSVGTLAAMFYRVCYLVWYLSQNILCREINFACKHLIVDAACIILSIILSSKITLVGENYFYWCILAFIVFTMSFVVTLILHLFFYKKTTIGIIKRGYKKFLKSR
ncbi:MAG: sugar isomerase [Coprococcus sp.]|nr:sugar isomerase [Coprococcus sp.]